MCDFHHGVPGSNPGVTFYPMFERCQPYQAGCSLRQSCSVTGASTLKKLVARKNRMNSTTWAHGLDQLRFSELRDNSSGVILRYRMNSITFEFPARFVRRYLKRDLAWGNES